VSDSPDLSLVDTQALLEELFARFDGVLVVRETSPDGKSNVTHYDYKGGASRCIGLAERAKMRLINMGENAPAESPYED
jgi:hypothetical protein